MHKFIRYAEQNGIPANREQIKISENIIYIPAEGLHCQEYD